MLDPLGRLRIDVAEIAERPFELPLPDRLCAASKLSDERLHVELAITPPESFDLFLDDRLDLGDLPQPRRHGVVEPRAEIVDVEEPNPGNGAHIAVHVSRYGEIDEDERPLLTMRHGGANGHRIHDRGLRRRRRDHDVSPRERFLERVEAVGGRAEAVCHLGGTLTGPVGHGHLRNPSTGHGLERLQADATRADDQGSPLAQVPEHPIRKRERHRARRCRVRSDRGLRTCAPPGSDGRAEEKRHGRPGRSGHPALLERVADLTEDLRFAEHERVEPGSDATEMAGSVLAGVHVQMVDQQVALDAVRVGQHSDQLVASVVDPVGEIRVELDPVARLQHGVLVDCGAPPCVRAERADTFAQLDGRCPMAEAEADETVHGRGTLYLAPEADPDRMRSVRTLGIDVGGTFTDAVLVADGELRTAKVLTEPHQEESVIAAAEAVGAEEIERFTHGTTIATNALLERRGARTAFVTTAGFEHLLHLRRQTRAHLYRPCAEHPPPLVPLERCAGVQGRMGRDGEIEPVDLSSLPDLDAEAIAVCLLFSFREPAHERAVGDELRRRYPRVHVVTSSEVAPEFREYERASTTVVDAYLSPVLGRYLRALATACREQGLLEPLLMRSSGGSATLEEAAEHAAFALLSGPAAGAVGAARIAALSGFENVLSFDMGGTSTDVCAILGGEARREQERVVGGFPIRLPTLAVHTVGAGGGSIVGEDVGGALRVGPESAGADPGPACYGRGGERATVTDANLLAGRLPPRLPGGIELDREAARRALGKLDPEAVIEIVNAEMVRALRVVSVEQGLDPRDFALVAFGGAGPLHACALAEELEMTTVLVPAAAGVLSALGLVAADERRDSVRSYVLPLADAGALPDQGEADLRYAGQSFELTVSLGPMLAERFHAAHEGRYGYSDRARPLELVAVRSAETRAAPPVAIAGPALVARGPEVLELAGATAWAPKGWSGETDAHGTLVLRRST